MTPSFLPKFEAHNHPSSLVHRPGKKLTLCLIVSSGSVDNGPWPIIPVCETFAIVNGLLD